MICPQELPAPKQRLVIAELGDGSVSFTYNGKKYVLKAKTIGELARAAYHFAKSLLEGKPGCVEPAKGAEPFKGMRTDDFPTLVEYMTLCLSPTFAKLYGRVRRVEYDPGTGELRWST